MSMFVTIDAARAPEHVQLARLTGMRIESLFRGSADNTLNHVAPHLVIADPRGVITTLIASNGEPGDSGIMLESTATFETMRRHLRRHLSVIRERDGRRVFFRFYDPRVLRAFLPVCNARELDQFFGPIDSFHCQGETAGSVLSFSRGGTGDLDVGCRTLAEFLASTIPGSSENQAARLGDNVST